MNLVDEHTTEYPSIDLRVEADPQMVGPRGGVLGYRVMDGSELVVYSASKSASCNAFCQGVAYARGVEA